MKNRGRAFHCIFFCERQKKDAVSIPKPALFVQQYLVQLPSKAQLEKHISTELERLR